MPKHIVLVSGAPGAGKSTLARPLATALGYALIGKDHIKETLYDALLSDAIDGTPNDLAYSRRIGGASMELLWALAATCPRVVLEANFRPHSPLERDRLSVLEGRIIEVYCHCPPATAARRFAARAARPGHHPAHPGKELTPEQLAEFDRPVGMGPVIQVDTTQPVDIPSLTQQVRQALQSPEEPLKE